MTESPTKSPRFNPSRADAQRVRIDLRSGQQPGGRSSSSGRKLRGLGVVLALAGILGGAYWAQLQGWIAIPGLSEVLARANPGGAASTETLLAPGAEPLAPLRYLWADGTAVARVVTIEPAVPAPGARGLRAEIEARFGASTSDGKRFIAFDLISLALTEPGADEAALAAAQASLMPVIEGFQGTLLASDRGELDRVQLELPLAPAEHQPLFDELARALTATVVTFPSEPIGLGARWRTGSAEHEIAELDAAGATVATTLEGSGTLRRRVAFAGLVETLDGEGSTAGAAAWRTAIRPR